MVLWKVIPEIVTPNTGETTGEFHVNFSNSRFGPYSHVFRRENLYFHESEWVRGSYFFPLESERFHNTEIFLETNEIVIWIGSRGSFDGQEKNFVEIISLKYREKYRFYPDEVSLIYNTKLEVVVYYKKSWKHHKLILDQKTLEKQSESKVELYAFFKLLYNVSEKSYYRLYFHANTSSPKRGYFEEQKMQDEDQELPKAFKSDKFILEVEYVYGSYIDVWESSLTWELAYIDPRDLW